MANILDATGVKVAREQGSSDGPKEQKSQTWLAGPSTPVGQRPMKKYKQYYDCLGKIADATAELEQGDNIGFTHKVQPVLEDIVIGLGSDQPVFFLATVDMLTEDARQKLGLSKPVKAKGSKSEGDTEATQ